jgi:peptidyl-prolyl cis-trans isomerase D
MALAFMRRHRKWLFVFLWLVIAAFVILYIPAFQEADASAPGAVVAEVGDQGITAGEFQRAYLRQRQMYGQIDDATAQSMGLRDQVLAMLVEQKLLLLEARRLGLQVDDEAVARAIATSPTFQDQGRFLGAQEVRRRLELQGMSEEEFTDLVRGQLLVQRLQALVTDGVQVSDAEAEREYRRRNEQIKAEYVLVSTAPFAGQVSATDQEIAARFQARREDYRVPEKRVVSYLLLDAPAFQSRAAVSDGEIQAYFEGNKEQFREEEQVCARHVLVKTRPTPESTEGHAEEEARALAQGALDQVKAGKDFAEVARAVSEDEGSKASGGDLGCFGRGRMVPEFENAAFSLEAGQTSEAVKSGYGYHVIQVVSRREETVPGLLQVKDRIRQTLVAQKTRTLLEEAAQSVAAALSRGRSLEQAAKEQGLAVQKSAPVARGEARPLLDSPALVARAFTLEKGKPSAEPVTVPRGYAFVVVDDVQASRLPELKEVQDRVKSDLVEEKARALARQRAAELRARAESEGLAKAAAALGLTRGETPALVGRGQPLGDMGASAGLEAAWDLAPSALSEPLAASAGWAVLRVTEKKAFDPAAFAAEKAALLETLRSQRKQQFFRSYLSSVRERFPVQRHPEAFRRMLG